MAADWPCAIDSSIVNVALPQMRGALQHVMDGGISLPPGVQMPGLAADVSPSSFD